MKILCCVAGMAISSFRVGLVDHLVERSLDPGLEVDLDLVEFGELSEGPATILAMVIHSRHPVGFHSLFVCLGIFAPVALDFDNQDMGFPFRSLKRMSSSFP